jgi:S-adenosylmethionine decarboxylase
MDLETGATHEGEHAAEGRANGTHDRAHLKVVDATADVWDDEREDHFIRRNGKAYAGTHLIIEVVRGEGLDDEARIQTAFRDCVDACGATLLHIHTHKFTPQGVSGVAVLAESHISVHTWPEIGYGAFDVFMCGDAQPWKAVEILRSAFNAEEMRVRELLRGDGIVA